MRFKFIAPTTYREIPDTLRRWAFMLTNLRPVGTTAQRPSDAQAGDTFLDTTLGQPIWFDGTNWIDATGAVV